MYGDYPTPQNVSCGQINFSPYVWGLSFCDDHCDELLQLLPICMGIIPCRQKSVCAKSTSPHVYGDYLYSIKKWQPDLPTAIFFIFCSLPAGISCTRRVDTSRTLHRSVPEKLILRNYRFPDHTDAPQIQSPSADIWSKD